MKILVLSPHPDDAELFCGGSISRLKRSGASVYHMVFSFCEESIKEGPKDRRIKESKEAQKVLAVDRLKTFNYPVRRLEKHRQEIFESLFRCSREYQPNMVFFPSDSDTHQDHRTVHNEAARAFKHTSMLCYGMNNSNQAFIWLSSEDLKNKIRAVGEFKSQKDKPYMNPRYIEALARSTGLKIGRKYAESFDVVKYVV